MVLAPHLVGQSMFDVGLSTQKANGVAVSFRYFLFSSQI